MFTHDYTVLGVRRAQTSYYIQCYRSHHLNNTVIMSGKLELSWTEDARSIGILEEVDDVVKYRPLIMFNFQFLG